MEDKTSGIRCSRPPALDELTLLAAADNDISPETLEHLQNCPYCTNRAREFVELQGQLRKRLYRAFCSSSDELAAYQQGLLDSARRATIASHLAVCAHCTRELELLAEAMTPPFLWLPTSSSPRRVIAEQCKLHPLSSFVLPREGSAQRSGRSYSYSAENVEVLLNIEFATDSERLVVSGTLLLGEMLAGPAYGATASLLCGERVVMCSVVDELGYFVIEDVPPGDYSLSLRMPDREVVVESLCV